MILSEGGGDLCNLVVIIKCVSWGILTTLTDILATTLKGLIAWGEKCSCKGFFFCVI